MTASRRFLPFATIVPRLISLVNGTRTVIQAGCREPGRRFRSMSADKSAKVMRYLEWIAPTPAPGAEAVEGRPSVLEGLEDTHWSSSAEVQLAVDAVDKLQRNEALTPEHVDAIEAIVLPKERPVVDVVDGTFAAPPSPFQHFGDQPARGAIEKALPSIGRVELPNHPSLPYAGTGFVVGQGLLMTNRHVAEIFSVGLGADELSFRPGSTAAVDFRRELDRPESHPFSIARVAMVHPYWDMALLVVDGLGDVPPLSLSTAAPGDLVGTEVAVIGYPALDPRNNVELQNRIFRGVFNVKRLAPGKLRPAAGINSFGHDVSATTHDSSTLGGNSGSAVVDVSTGKVVGLHFAGRYLEANYAVPTHDLALDGRVVDAGVNFDADAGHAAPTAWDSFWAEADPPGGGAAPAPRGPEHVAATASRTVTHDGQGLTWSIPLEVTVQIRSGAATVTAGAGAAEAEVEKLAEPFRDEDFSGRHGYDDQFVGVAVPVPTVLDESVVSRLDDGSFLLPYEHFSIVMDKERRLALFTASNVDASPQRKEPEPGRDYTRRGLTGLGKNDQEKWFTDPRIPAIHQLPDRFFTKDRKSFDKGHIVRREDVAWGDSYDELRRANGDTFHVTNCSPQVANFNRSAKKGLWGELENIVLKQAGGERYCLFAGPVFAADDPLFSGLDDDGTIHVPIPRQFWKIVVARSGDRLQSFAFVLDQDLSHTDLEFAVDAEWRTRMISIPNLEARLTLVRFPQELHDSDQIDAGPGESVRSQTRIETIAG
jgi:endonuclease G, mitochondrial